MRKDTLARRIGLGVVPGRRTGAQAAGIQEWDALTADKKKVFPISMEIYAASAKVGGLRNGADGVSTRSRLSATTEDGFLLHHRRRQDGLPRRPERTLGSCQYLDRAAAGPLDVPLKHFNNKAAPNAICYLQQSQTPPAPRPLVGPPVKSYQQKYQIHESRPLAEGHKGREDTDLRNRGT